MRYYLAVSALLCVSAPSLRAQQQPAPAKVYKVGDAVDFDHWTMVVTRVQPRWSSPIQRPTAGSRFVAVEIQVANHAAEARNAPVPFFCTMVQASGGEHVGMLIMIGARPKFDASNIPANQSRTGWATYQVADQAGLLFECQPGLAADATMSADAMLIWNLGL